MGAPTPPEVHAESFQRQFLHRFQDEMDQMVFRKPLPQVCRKQHRRRPIYAVLIRPASFPRLPLADWVPFPRWLRDGKNEARRWPG